MSLGRLLLAWLAMAVAMSANGVFREMGRKRWLDVPTADLVSAAIGAVIILLLTFFFFRALAGSSTRTLLFVSAFLVVLTVIFEVAIGRLVDRRSWTELLGNYAIWRGRLWPALLLLIALTPFIWGRWLAKTSPPPTRVNTDVGSGDRPPR